MPVSSPSPLPKRKPGELMLRTLREHWLAILVFATESEASISVQQHAVFILPCCAIFDLFGDHPTSFVEQTWAMLGSYWAMLTLT